jgi:hypothetical protein
VRNSGAATGGARIQIPSGRARFCVQLTSRASIQPALYSNLCVANRLPSQVQSHTRFISRSAAKPQDPRTPTACPPLDPTAIYHPGVPALRCEKPKANHGRYMPTKT